MGLVVTSHQAAPRHIAAQAQNDSLVGEGLKGGLRYGYVVGNSDGAKLPR